MDIRSDSAPHYTTMDVCLGGVFIGRGERVPDDLYASWQRRLRSLGLESAPESADAPEPSR